MGGRTCKQYNHDFNPSLRIQVHIRPRDSGLQEQPQKYWGTGNGSQLDKLFTSSSSMPPIQTQEAILVSPQTKKVDVLPYRSRCLSKSVDNLARQPSILFARDTILHKIIGKTCCLRKRRLNLLYAIYLHR